MSQHPAEFLFDELKKIDYYPSGVVPFPSMLHHTSFFPGGFGLWNTNQNASLPPFPIDKIMIVGQDWGVMKDFLYDLKNPGKNLNSPTWRRLIDFIKETDIDMESCFFTNALMGLREGGSPIEKHPADKDRIFVANCQRFFLTQLEVQKPRLIITLGKYVPRFLADISSDLNNLKFCKTFSEIDSFGALQKDVVFKNGIRSTVVSLVQPSYRHLNVRHRKYKGLTGHEAELALVKDAYKFAFKSD